MKTQLLTSLLLIATVSILTLAGVTGSHAQATDSILVGTVTDPSDSLVPNASVTATNLATGVKYTGATNAAGEYRINNVPVGTYDVEASATGIGRQ